MNISIGPALLFWRAARSNAWTRPWPPSRRALSAGSPIKQARHNSVQQRRQDTTPCRPPQAGHAEARHNSVQRSAKTQLRVQATPKDSIPCKI
jgi:hypothetical protein